MHDSCLHFMPGVSNPDQGKRMTLELYLTFELSAGEDAAFTNNLVIPYIDKYVVLPFTN